MSGEQILVVEDQPSTARILSAQVQALGYRVPVIACCADEAIDLAAAHHPDVILMDIRLGQGMDGIQAAAEIVRSASPSIIYLTAHASGETLNRLLQSKPAAVLHKPVRQKELETTLRLVLETRPEARQCDVPSFSALNIANRFGGTLAQALDHLPTGVMLVDASLQVIYLNSRAKLICKLSPQIWIEGQRLVTNQASQSVSLQQRISGMSPACSLDPEKVSTLCLASEGNEALELLISPVRTDRENQQQHRPCALLFLFDQRQYHGILSDMLTGLYGLTVAEARLASKLARNHSLENAAAALGITINTARTHLKRIFNKTRTHRQSELIHRIDTGPAGLMLQMSED